MSNRETDVDYQLGAHEIDKSGSIAEGDEIIEFEYETGAVFRRLADDIYETAEAGIREPLTNSITTVRKVFGRECEDGGIIEITVQDGDQLMMRIRDNGEGISKDVLEEVLTVIGRSSARDDGELSGQYGMGFLASYKLVGMDGGFLMCTNPRNSSEGPYSGLFKPGTFEPDTNNSLRQLLGEDEYGTVFEYYIRDSITMKNIREWVEKHAKWSPVPVIYREINEDGNEKYNQEFYAPEIPDMLDGSPYLHIENEYYEAATSPGAENDIVLISSPVSMRGSRTLRKNLPWNVDLRLKYENSIIFKGSNEGLIPVSEKEYESMSEDRKDNYIKEDNLDVSDTKLPSSTGTRERLRRKRDFLNHVNSQLRQKYLSQVEDTLDSFDPKTMSMTDLSEMGRDCMLKILGNLEDKNNPTKDDIKSTLSNSYNYSNPSGELLEFLKAMVSTVPVISDGKMYNNQYKRVSAYEMTNRDGKVFMCVSNNSWKQEAVEKSNEKTHIVKLEEADQYDMFEKHLRWNKLKDINRSNATELLELESEDLEDFVSRKSSSQDSIKDKSITVHYEGGGRDTENMRTKSIVEKFSSQKSKRFGQVLILFPRASGENISNYYWLADNGCSLCSCGKKVSEYLTSNCDDIVRYEDYYDWIKNRLVRTPEGTKNISDVLDYEHKIFHAPKNRPDILDNSEVLSHISSSLKNDEHNDDFIFAVTDSEIWTHISNNRDRISSENLSILRTNRDKKLSFSDVEEIRRSNLVHTFLTEYIPEEIQKYDEFKTVVNRHREMSKDVLTDAHILLQIHRDGYFSTDQHNEQFYNNLPNHKTKLGEMTIEQIYDEFEADEVIIHRLSSDKIEYFSSDEMLKLGCKLGSAKIDGNKVLSKNDVIYVPVLKSEFREISDRIKDKTVIIGKRDYFNDHRIDASAKYVYAKIRLNSFYDSQIQNIINNTGFSESVKLVDSIASIRDRDAKSIYRSDIEELMDSRDSGELD